MDLTQSGATFGTLVNGILGIINLLIPAIFAVVFLVLVWKVIDAWVINGADEKKRAEGRQLLIVAVVVFVIMVSTWGIISLLRSSLF